MYKLWYRLARLRLAGGCLSNFQL